MDLGTTIFYRGKAGFAHNALKHHAPSNGHFEGLLCKHFFIGIGILRLELEGLMGRLKIVWIGAALRA